jgi:AmiR/NasT family two-component response regulator
LAGAQGFAGGAAVTEQQLEDADQVVIWRAQGILMERLGCEPIEADVWLRWRARIDKRTVVEAAVQLVTRNAH